MVSISFTKHIPGGLPGGGPGGIILVGIFGTGGLGKSGMVGAAGSGLRSSSSPV